VSPHAISEYIKYRLRAKGRHGVHSPFVYSFVEEVLRGKGILEEKMERFLRKHGLHSVRLPALPGQLWQYDGQTVFVFSDIHKDTVHTAAWQALINNPAVTLSIDLYRTGLLFFHPDFKVKQHFVLK